MLDRVGLVREGPEGDFQPGLEAVCLPVQEVVSLLGPEGAYRRDLEGAFPQVRAGDFLMDPASMIHGIGRHRIDGRVCKLAFLENRVQSSPLPLPVGHDSIRFFAGRMHRCCGDEECRHWTGDPVRSFPVRHDPWRRHAVCAGGPMCPRFPTSGLRARALMTSIVTGQRPDEAKPPQERVRIVGEAALWQPTETQREGRRGPRNRTRTTSRL